MHMTSTQKECTTHGNQKNESEWTDDNHTMNTHIVINVHAIRRLGRSTKKKCIKYTQSRLKRDE